MHDRRELARRFVEDILTGDRHDVVDEILTTDFTFRGNDDADSRDEFKTALNSMRSKFPDITFTVRELLVDGNGGCASVEIEGSHGGELMGIAPTNRRFRIPAAYLLSFREDRIAAAEVILDTLAVLIQLGVWAPPTSAADAV